MNGSIGRPSSEVAGASPESASTRDHVRGVDDDIDERIARCTEALRFGGPPEDRNQGIEASLADGAWKRVLVGGIAELDAACLDVGPVLGLGEPLMDRHQFGGREPVAAVGRDVDHAADVADMGVAMLDRVVACIVSSVFVGKGHEPVDALGELAVWQLLGLVEQDRGELGQSVANSAVVVDAGEASDL